MSIIVAPIHTRVMVLISEFHLPATPHTQLFRFFCGASLFEINLNEGLNYNHIKLKTNYETRTQITNNLFIMINITIVIKMMRYHTINSVNVFLYIL